MPESPSPPTNPSPRRPAAPRGVLVRGWACGGLVVGAILVAALAGGWDEGEAMDGARLHEGVRSEGLPLLIATNHAGLGKEAQSLVAWTLRNRGPLTIDSARLSVEGAGALPRPFTALSPEMARTLRRLNEWHGLAATEANPITHDQLRSGALAKASVLRIRALFEEAIRRAVRVGGQWLIPESGGEASIDEELRLIEGPDPRWSTIQDLARLGHDSRAVSALYESRPVEMALVDAHGLLKVAVARLVLGAPGSSDEVQRAVVTVARNAAPTYSLGPEEHLTLVTSRDWRGRYVGGWHTHAPHESGGEWAGGDVPSFEDMQNAVRLGQFLTLSFQPDGFDLYDAEPLADAGRIDLGLLKVIRYRSNDWRAYFRRLRPPSP